MRPVHAPAEFFRLEIGISIHADRVGLLFSDWWRMCRADPGRADKIAYLQRIARPLRLLTQNRPLEQSHIDLHQVWGRFGSIGPNAHREHIRSALSRDPDLNYDYSMPPEPPAFGPCMVCTACGMVGADVLSNWQERPARERARNAVDKGTH